MCFKGNHQYNEKSSQEMEENIFESYKNKGLVSTIQKEDLKRSNEKIVNPITIVKVFEDFFLQKIYKWLINACKDT